MWLYFQNTYKGSILKGDIVRLIHNIEYNYPTTTLHTVKSFVGVWLPDILIIIFDIKCYDRMGGREENTKEKSKMPPVQKSRGLWQICQKLKLRKVLIISYWINLSTTTNVETDDIIRIAAGQHLKKGWFTWFHNFLFVYKPEHRYCHRYFQKLR